MMEALLLTQNIMVNIFIVHKVIIASLHTFNIIVIVII